MIFYVTFVTIKIGGAYADKCEKPLPKRLIAVKQKTRRKWKAKVDTYNIMFNSWSVGRGCAQEQYSIAIWKS